jgi:hypothetical protein
MGTGASAAYAWRGTETALKSLLARAKSCELRARLLLERIHVQPGWHVIEVGLTVRSLLCQCEPGTITVLPPTDRAYLISRVEKAADHAVSIHRRR